MSYQDPNLQWNGQQWMRWDGYQWRPESAPMQPYVAATPPQQTYLAGGMAPYATTQSSRNVQATIAWILTVLTLGYMLPWAVAATRGKSNTGAIGLLNLFVGWTIIGWIAALVMACGAHQVVPGAVNVAVVNATAYPPQPYAGPQPPPGAQTWQPQMPQSRVIDAPPVWQPPQQG